MDSDVTVSAPPSAPPPISFRSELARKATHMFALVIPAGYYVLGLGRGTMLAVMIPVALCTFFVDLARLQGRPLWRDIFGPLFGRMIRAHEAAGDFTGATYILASTVATVALFPKAVAVAALAFTVVGDSLAAVIGRRFGRRRFLHGKSVEGSLACLAGTVIVALLTPNLAAPAAFAGALAATVVEALPLQIDDNVTIPLLSGLVMTLVLRILG
ncbi:MAG TPA: phosphatidate cytidylyltransferase [candidate division Zixibacteria bacterium]|nr:phosphatidate cytidylyltransferase [candidate division Zixibacteria bacterium]MDD4917100.1 phosphatidate cytidylyltransferase [candidate division Zixibacteria bacterium]MDM7972716.1 phosphatidate cytidylyltransferase [candidate division Zixibacteria bacterium]HOD65326.1 phosphatidate cytidylyltransferase [candidate division Zixibacteria bacterium]HOZ08045.1 phosphatidate cytidylyltransferase [candidate division Zixibacteria bacterium]